MRSEAYLPFQLNFAKRLWSSVPPSWNGKASPKLFEIKGCTKWEVEKIKFLFPQLNGFLGQEIIIIIFCHFVLSLGDLELWWTSVELEFLEQP